MKKIIAGIGATLLLSPMFLFAQVSVDPVIPVLRVPPSCTALTHYLYRGSTDATTGGEVTLLQKFLVATGHLDIKNTVSGYGFFGGYTESAVIAFQKANGIELTGTVGKTTRAKIQALSCGNQGGQTVTITKAPELTLSYNSAKQESQLKGTAQITVTAGAKDLRIPQYLPVQTSLNGNYSNSYKTTVTPTTPLVVGSTANGMGYFKLLAGQTVTFDIVVLENPQIMFAGSYYFTINYFNIITDQDIYTNLPVPANASAKVVIVGEQMPYITSVSSSVKAGDQFVIVGERMDAVSVYLDGSVYVPANPKDIVITDGKKIVFTTPSSLTPGSHTVFVKNTKGQSSQKLFTYTTSNALVVKLLSPNGGETYKVGTAIPFSWTINYKPATLRANLNHATIGIVASYPLSTAIGTGTSEFLAESTKNSGTYTISVCDENKLCDYSDNSFTVTASTPSSVVSVSNTSASYTLISDQGGASAANVKFAFTITNTDNREIYINKNPGSAFVMSYEGPTGKNAKLSALSSGTVSGDTSTSYVISSGTSRSFIVYGVIGSEIVSMGGLTVYSISAINYSYSTAAMTTGQAITTGLSNLKVAVTLSSTSASGVLPPNTIAPPPIVLPPPTTTSTGTGPIIPPPTLPKTIWISSPNGGENVIAGGTQTIKWTSTGIPATDMVRISLYKNNVFLKNIVTSYPNVGTYVWTVGTITAGTDYSVRVTLASDASIRDTSDANFRISAAGISMTPSQSTAAILEAINRLVGLLQ